MRYPLILFFTLACCFGLQTLALRNHGGRTNKSESNFFSSIGRIQAGAKGKAELMVLGSSITGRLPDRAQGFAGSANMGCDGGSAVDALRAMDAGILPAAPQLIIEANTLSLALNREPTEVGRAMRRPWFKVGLHCPNLAAYARPSAFLYSRLLARKIGGFDLKPGEDLGVTSRPALVFQAPGSAVSPRETEVITEVSAILRRLEAKGSRSMIVWLPPARRNANPPSMWILELARKSGIPYWDLGQEAAPNTVILTDGVHMAAPSAARTMASLMKILD